MMKFDEVRSDLRGAKSEDNESFEFKRVRDHATGFISRSLSSSDNKQAETDNSDNDSGFLGVSRGSLDDFDTATSDEKSDEDVNSTSVPEASEVYDRDSILRKLARPENIGIFRTLLKIARTQKYSDGESRVGDDDEGGREASDASKRPSESIRNSTLEDTDEENPQSRYERIREALQAIPDSLLHSLTGIERPGDCGRPSDQKPDWLDEEKVRLGQKFVQDHTFPVHYAQMLSLFVLFSFEDGLKPLVMTGKSSTPYTAFKRYLSTGLRVRNWSTQDLWAKGSSARKDILTVRAMHAATRRRLEASTNEEIDLAGKIPEAWCPTRDILLEDFSDSCEPPLIGQCPYVTWKNSSDRPKGINQNEMALTQWGFVGLIICYPKHFGVHYATEEELEAFCHLWRSIGYQLGMEDEFNFCRGTLDEIRQRSHDFLETWVKPNLRIITPEWEHMMRCVISGMAVILPGADFETSILYLGEILGLEMPRLYASLSYKSWIQHNIRRYMFAYAIKLPRIAGFMNNLVNRALDRGENLTPEMMEAIRLKLCQYPGIDSLDGEGIVRKESST